MKFHILPLPVIGLACLSCAQPGIPLQTATPSIPSTLSAVEANEMAMDSVIATDFSARVMVSVDVPAGLPLLPDVAIAIPFEASVGGGGCSLAMDGNDMVVNAVGNSTHIPPFSASLHGSRDSGLWGETFAPDSGESVRFYVDGPTWSSCLDLIGNLIQQQSAQMYGEVPADGELREQIAEAMILLIESPQDPAPQNQLQVLIMQALAPMFHLELKSVSEGRAVYGLDLFTVLPAACHRLADLAPWDAIEYLMDGFGAFEWGMIQKMRHGDLEKFQALGKALQQIASAELLYSCVPLAGNKLFFADASLEIQFHSAESIEAGIRDLATALEYFLPTEAVNPMELSPMLAGFAGVKLFAGYRMENLDLSPIAVGTFNVTEKEITNAEDYSPMVAGFLPLIEMAMEQQFGGGVSGEEEF